MSLRFLWCGTGDCIEFERKSIEEQEFIINELEELIARSESLLSEISCFSSEMKKENMSFWKQEEYYILLENQHNLIRRAKEISEEVLNISKRFFSEK